MQIPALFPTRSFLKMRQNDITSLCRMLVSELTSGNRFVGCLCRDRYGLFHASSSSRGLRDWLVLMESNSVLVFVVALVVESDRERTTRRKVEEEDHDVLEAPMCTVLRHCPSPPCGAILMRSWFTYTKIEVRTVTAVRQYQSVAARMLSLSGI